MSWKSFVFGAVIGLTVGYVVREAIGQTRNVDPEKVLEHMKNEFKKSGAISGSWIQMEAEPYEKGMIHYQVYKGGITKQENDKNEQFEFIADAATGTILDVQRISTLNPVS